MSQAVPRAASMAPASPALSGAIRGYHIDTDLRDWEVPSDHVPVLATFEV